jgi:hypothetical protein
MRHTQAQDAQLRGLDPAAQALREVLEELLQDDEPARRLGAMIAGTDIRYPLPGEHPLIGTFLDEPIDQRAARPVLLDPTGGTELRETAEGWADRVDIRPTKANAVLVRPDGTVVWAGGPGLREALATWFGEPITKGS